ncbi:MAG: hypothetical protein KBG35_07560, partial [Thauera sp.]|nr:hypothetical protein [Thauera sp.]
QREALAVTLERLAHSPQLHEIRADAVDHGLALAENETPATVGRARAATPPPPVGAAQAAISGCSRGSE